MNTHIVFALIFASLVGISEAKYEGWPPEVVKLLEDEETRNWKGPPIIEDNYNYYMSGFDFDGKPIWVMEWGRWNMRRIIEKNLEKDFEKFNDRMYVHLTESLANATKEGDEWNPGLVIIIDTEGFTAEQLTSPETVSYILRMFRTSLPRAVKVADKVYVINAHFVVQNMINILRPILGDVLESVKVFGTDKAKWKAQLLNDLPKESIPEWYGGNPGFKPLQVYG